MNGRTKAVAIVEIQVVCDSVWSDDTTFDQIVKQAATDALGRINKLFGDALTPDHHLRTKRNLSTGVSLVEVKKIIVRAETE